MIISLRRRLVAIVLGLTLLTWFVSVIATGMHSQRMLIRQIDEQLSYYLDMAQHTMSAVVTNPEVSEYFAKRTTATKAMGKRDVSRVSSFGSDKPTQAMNLWFGSSQILVGDNAPDFSPPTVPGVSTQSIQGRRGTESWRVLYRYDSALDIWLVVGVNLEHAKSETAANSWRLVYPLFLILPLTISILMYGVGRGLRPLRDLADKISSRQLHALEPIDMADVPSEIKPVITSLNDLLIRLGRSLNSEHRFTSDAAHELQTPLAAIKAEVQRCQHQPVDANTKIMLDRISMRVSRATDTVRQLLTLARLDPDQDFKKEKIALKEMVLDVIADLGGVAADRMIDVNLENMLDAEIAGNVDWIRVLLRNIINNAFVHSTSPGTVHITLVHENDRAYLRVENDCEPISDEVFSQLTRRFYRPLGNSSSGVGLGLSIVERIVGLHGGSLALAPLAGRRGFSAEVDFPRY